MMSPLIFRVGSDRARAGRRRAAVCAVNGRGGGQGSGGATQVCVDGMPTEALAAHRSVWNVFVCVCL